MAIIKIFLFFLVTINDSIANDLLASITAKLVKHPITQGEFQQEKQLKFLSKPLTSTGTFTYHQSQGVIWQTVTPIHSILLIKDTQLSSDQGLQAIPPAFGRVFKALLGGNMAALTDDFAMTGMEKKSVWQLQLSPKDELLRKVISSIQVRGDTELRTINLQEINGNSTHIEFKKISHPTQLTSDQHANFERLSP